MSRSTASPYLATCLLLTALAALPVSAAEFTVTVSNNVYTPRTLTIAAGDTVIWRNQAGTHDVISDSGVFNSGDPRSGNWTYTFRFDNAGNFPYFCSLHGGPGGIGMAGQVTVVAPSVPGSLALAAGQVGVGESGGNAVVVLQRLGGDDGAVSVRLRSSDGTATAGEDYTAVDTVVSWADNDGAAKTILVPILPDTRTEPNETFTLTLSEPTGGGTLQSPTTATVTISDDDGAVGPCVADANTLCLVDGRFRVTVDWTNQFNGTSGVGGTIEATDLSGYFFFDNANNVELIMKMLPFDDVFKFFYGQLTNLIFEITVVDTHTGAVKVYPNGQGNCGDIDQSAFAKSQRDWRKLERWINKRVVRGKGKAGSCVANETTLCLLDNRFALELVWRNQFSGDTGSGQQGVLSNLTGTFTFTDPANVELMVKTLDFGGQILVIYGALSDLEYTLTVRDTISDTSKTYHNPAGRYCGGLDDNAF